jgi:hypothetical protein
MFLKPFSFLALPSLSHSSHYLDFCICSLFSFLYLLSLVKSRKKSLLSQVGSLFLLAHLSSQPTSRSLHQAQNPLMIPLCHLPHVARRRAWAPPHLFNHPAYTFHSTRSPPRRLLVNPSLPCFSLPSAATIYIFHLPQILRVLLIWACKRRWSPILGLHRDEGSSLQIGMPGRPTICNN